MDPGKSVTGSPAYDMTAALRSQAVSRKLPELEKKIKELEAIIKQLLAGKATRWDEEKKLFEFIRNSDHYTKNNDYVQTTSVNKTSIGHKFQNLSDAEIRSVVEYIRHELEGKYK